MIYETLLISASNSDVLSAGRLNAIPFNGMLTLDFLADLADVTNNYVLTIQKPEGEVPVDGQVVAASGSGADGVLDERELMRFSFRAGQGGHFTVSLTEAGTATCMFRAVLRP